MKGVIGVLSTTICAPCFPVEKTYSPFLMAFNVFTYQSRFSCKSVTVHEHFISILFRHNYVKPFTMKNECLIIYLFNQIYLF